MSRKRKRGEKAGSRRTGRAAKRGLWVATIERAKPGFSNLGPVWDPEKSLALTSFLNTSAGEVHLLPFRH